MSNARLNHIQYRKRQINRSLAEITRQINDIEDAYGPLCNRDSLTKSDRQDYETLESMASDLLKEYEQLNNEELKQ
jgi:hypothetical protein